MRKVHVRGAAVLTVVPADCSEEEVLDDAIITASCRSTKVDIEDASLDNVVKSRHKVMGAAVSLFLKADDDADLGKVLGGIKLEIKSQRGKVKVESTGAWVATDSR